MGYRHLNAENAAGQTGGFSLRAETAVAAGRSSDVSRQMALRGDRTTILRVFTKGDAGAAAISASSRAATFAGSSDRRQTLRKGISFSPVAGLG